MSRTQSERNRFTVIGAAIIDVLAGPVSNDVFQNGSMPMDYIQTGFGGDALNEAVVLARLGGSVELISILGKDPAGDQVLSFLKENHVSTDKVRVTKDLATGVNIVLTDKAGERFFLTNPASSLRKLAVEDILPYVEEMGDYVSFASMFVSPLLGIKEMEMLFQAVKSRKGRTLQVDLTRAKQGERLEDLQPLFPYIDYLMPNETEIACLTGEKDPRRNLQLLLDHGVKNAVIKIGKDGCLVGISSQKDGKEPDRPGIYHVPAYPVNKVVDTTGAGDSFAAGFLWAGAEGMPVLERAKFACAAASCAVERAGATEGIRTREEVMKRYLHEVFLLG